MRTLYKTTTPKRITLDGKVFELMEHTNENYIVSFKELAQRNFLKVITIPKKSLSYEKKQMFKSHSLFYKQIAVLDSKRNPIILKIER